MATSSLDRTAVLLGTDVLTFEAGAHLRFRPPARQ